MTNQRGNYKASPDEDGPPKAGRLHDVGLRGYPVVSCYPVLRPQPRYTRARASRMGHSVGSGSASTPGQVSGCPGQSPGNSRSVSECFLERREYREHAVEAADREHLQHVRLLDDQSEPGRPTVGLESLEHSDQDAES